MNLSDGYGAISYEGKEYLLTPSFYNLSKLGNPVEIVEKLHDLHLYSTDHIKAYIAACDILEACGLPEMFYGGIDFSEWQNRVVIRCGVIAPHDVITLANHCMMFGMCGSYEQLEKRDGGEGGVISEFDPAEYIVVAKEYLSLTLEEAENLTMAKFVRLSSAKRALDERRKMKENGVPTREESEARLKAHDRAVEEYEKARLARLAKKGEVNV